ncbi:MAG: twin-arginine translocase TatA/TatE family subunit [Carboxydocellales bacterium]
MLGFIGPLGIPELIVILVLALLIFGPGKLPEAGKAVGKGINEFKRASKDVQKEFSEAINQPENDKK